MSDFNDDTNIPTKLVPIYKLTLIKNRPELGEDSGFEQIEYTYFDITYALRQEKIYKSQGWETNLERVQ